MDKVIGFIEEYYYFLEKKIRGTLLYFYKVTNSWIGKSFDFFDGLRLFEFSYEQYEGIFFRQRHSWDCGVACCCMILKYLGRSGYEKLYEHPLVLRNRCSPLWTIDLFDLLQQSGLSHIIMFTTSNELSNHHFQIPWYKTAFQDEDIDHIRRQFEKAKKFGWNVIKHELSISSLTKLLSARKEVKRKCIAIILLNNLALNEKSFNDEDENCCDQFVGHYIVLVHYNRTTDEFFYLNPSSPGVAVISKSSLDKAWCHPGTDKDIIICGMA